VDPESRRDIWRIVKSELARGCGALVTTHMMEEAEALCTKLVILTNGKVAATGSTQELRSRWGSG